jgi:hypothetical protein
LRGFPELAYQAELDEAIIFLQSYPSFQGGYLLILSSYWMAFSTAWVMRAESCDEVRIKADSSDFGT